MFIPPSHSGRLHCTCNAAGKPHVSSNLTGGSMLKEELDKLINKDNLSYREIGKIMNMSDNGVKKVAKKLGVKLPKRRRINPKETFNKIDRYCLNCGKAIKTKKFCSKSCNQEFKYNEWINKWKNGEKTGLRGAYGTSLYIKRYLFKKYNNKCSKCGWGEINPFAKTIPLEIEHIDGNYSNNLESNLILLCPNCHSLTSTYKGANRGHGRKERAKYY